MDIQTIIDLDHQLLPFFNGSDSLFLDRWMVVLTSGITWIPLYLSLLYLVVKNNETMAQILLIVGCAFLCVVLSDGMADMVAKPLVARPRPGNDPLFKYTVRVVNDLRGTDFSFFSAHAANTFSLAVFFCCLVRDRLLGVVLVAWSLLNCYTRLYLGLHYPSDITVGLLWGGVSGMLAYFTFRKIYHRISPRLNYISSQYTATGYQCSDVDIVAVVFLLTLVYTLFRTIL